MLKYVIISLLTLLAVWAWKIFNWAWLEPRRMEKFLRKQGLKGNSYRFLLGDSVEIADMYKEANSKPLDPLDDIAPRVMPFIEKTIRTYGMCHFLKPYIFALYLIVYFTRFQYWKNLISSKSLK